MTAPADDTSASIPAMPYASIGALLHAAAHPHNFVNEGDNAVVFRFPKDAVGMEHYVLRIKKEKSVSEDDSAPDFRKALLGSSALTPVPHLVAQRHIGQPLMALDRNAQVTIHAYQPGISLRPLENLRHLTYERNPAHTEEALQLMDRIAAIAGTHGIENPFLPILQDAYRLGAMGYYTDFSLRNLQLDEEGQRLTLVDQTDYKDGSYRIAIDKAHPELWRSADVIHLCLKNLSELSPDTATPEGAHFMQRLQQLEDWVDEARYKVAENPPDFKTISFANVNDTSAIALSSPPDALVKRLSALHQDASLPRYRY